LAPDQQRGWRAMHQGTPNGERRTGPSMAGTGLNSADK
jgi:hypothetical protein